MVSNGLTSKGIRVHSLDEFGFDTNHIQSNVKEVTRLLNERIEQCNNDPRFEHPIYKKKDGYVAIRKGRSFPEFYEGIYLWKILYEPGSGGTTSGPTIFYFPNARKKLDILIEDGLADVSKQKEERWRALNPDIDLENDLYEISGRIISDSYQDVLDIVYSMFNDLMESRLRK